MKTTDSDLAIERLIEKLQDPDLVVRLYAATVLGGMGGNARPAVLPLVGLLRSGDVRDRRLAALTLGEIGPAAGAAIPALFGAADDEDYVVSDMALQALERIDLVGVQAEAA